MQIKLLECVLSHDQQICVMSHVYTEKMSNVKGHQQQEKQITKKSACRDADKIMRMCAES
jgi:hypothetical protein